MASKRNVLAIIRDETKLCAYSGTVTGLSKYMEEHPSASVMYLKYMNPGKNTIVRVDLGDVPQRGCAIL